MNQESPVTIFDKKGECQKGVSLERLETRKTIKENAVQNQSKDFKQRTSFKIFNFNS
jgi:hypothetical protein